MCLLCACILSTCLNVCQIDVDLVNLVIHPCSGIENTLWNRQRTSKKMICRLRYMVNA